MSNCYQGINIPLNLQQDPCNGETKSSACIIHPDELVLLELPQNSSVRNIINTYAIALNSALNRIQALEIASENTEQPYNIYRALLNQEGDTNPIPTVLENTFSEEIVWKRMGIGVYTAEIPSGFNITKTFYKSNGMASVNVQLFSFVNLYNNKLVLNIRDITTNMPVDNNLNNTPIEILVYN